MTLALNDVATWLTDYLTTAGVTAPVQVNRLQDEPDEAVAVAVLGGSSPILDGAFETAHVQVRVRGADDATAESLALLIHEHVSGAEGSFQMGSTYVLTTEPSTGPPQYFDRDVANRTTYVSTYQFTVAV